MAVQKAVIQVNITGFLKSLSSTGDEGFVGRQLKGIVTRSNRTERKINYNIARMLAISPIEPL